MSKKILRAASLLVVATVAALTTFAVSADESTPKLNLSEKVTGNPGECVSVDVYVSDAALEYDSLGLMVEYDKSLTLQKVGSEYGDMGYGVASNNDYSYCLVYDYMGEPFRYENGDTLFTFEFIIPEDASKDQSFDVKWAESVSFKPIISNTASKNDSISFELCDSEDCITCLSDPEAKEAVTDETQISEETVTAAEPVAVKTYDSVDNLISVSRRELEIQKINKDLNYSQFLNQYYIQQQKRLSSVVSFR